MAIQHTTSQARNHSSPPIRVRLVLLREIRWMKQQLTFAISFAL